MEPNGVVVKTPFSIWEMTEIFKVKWLSIFGSASWSSLPCNSVKATSTLSIALKLSMASMQHAFLVYVSLLVEVVHVPSKKGRRKSLNYHFLGANY